MTDQPKKFMLPPQGEPVIPFFNWGGMRALYVKEVRRFFKVHLQTIWAPAITTLLYLVIFTVALGSGGRQVLGVPFASFIAPGLIMMGMMQNAFANSSFSLLAAIVGAAVTRAVLVGLAIWAVMIFWPGVDVMPQHPVAMLWFGLMGAIMLSLLGVMTSIWADKFDHAAAVTNFVVAPLSLLSGTFYSVDSLHAGFQAISHANPFFYVISGFRFGFIGLSDSPILVGAVALLILNAVLAAVSYALLDKGWKIKS